MAFAAARPGALGKLVPNTTALFVCDIQERFRPVISGFPAVIDTAARMVRGAALLEIPVVVTEQYPKALGPTVPEVLGKLAPDALVVDKTDFSMLVPDVQAFLRHRPHLRQVLLTGIEAHVCVLQTALDLLGAGYEVHVMVDGCSSSRYSDRSVAFQRIAQSGGLLATSEMALFQLAGSSRHPAFKGISGLAKEVRPALLPTISSL